MQPLKVTLLGDFWDSQIYRGRLYVWGMDGRLTVLNWDAFIDHISERSSAPLAVTLAFARGDLPYSDSTSFLLKHGEFREWMTSEFAKAANESLVFSMQDLLSFEFGSQQNPFRELPTDTEIFNNRLYAVDDSGLWSCTAHRASRKYPVSSRPDQHWDAAIFALKAKGGRLALAAGDEGLFEYDVRDLGWEPSKLSDASFVDERVIHLSKRHCTQADWNFSSVYASSNQDGGFLAAFDWERRFGHDHDEGDDWPFYAPAEASLTLHYLGALDEEELELGGQVIYSWGGQDKIYSINQQSQLSSVKFRQAFLKAGFASNLPFSQEKQPFTRLSQRIFNRSSEIVSGGVGIFGTIIETADQLTVIESDTTEHLIQGPIVKWRVFPRARRYENHLHVVLENRLEIFAFLGDYEVDQSSKIFGAEYRSDVGALRRS